jgi:ankyrin repeat protein
MTALHIACASRATDPDLIGALIRHDLGGMAIAQDYEGKTPLHHLLFYVCYPKRKESLHWGRYGYCHGDSYSIANESRNSVKAEFEGSSLSISQEEFNAIVTCINLLCKYGVNSLFVRDNADNTPIDVLHECKASLAEGVKKGPKWERADIINIIVRQRLIKFYRQQRRIAESNSLYKPEQDALPGSWSSSGLPDLQSSSVMDSDAFSSGAGTFTGLSKMEVTDISIGDSIMSIS